MLVMVCSLPQSFESWLASSLKVIGCHYSDIWFLLLILWIEFETLWIFILYVMVVQLSSFLWRIIVFPLNSRARKPSWHDFWKLITNFVSLTVIIKKWQFAIVYPAHRSRVSSVSIVSDYGLDDRAIEVRSPAGAKDFSYNVCVQTGYGVHPASCTMGTEGPLPGGKARPGRDANHSPQLVPRSLMSRSYILSPEAPPWHIAGLLYFYILPIERFNMWDFRF
jgi:hypothetical protein